VDLIDRRIPIENLIECLVREHVDASHPLPDPLCPECQGSDEHQDEAR